MIMYCMMIIDGKGEGTEARREREYKHEYEIGRRRPLDIAPEAQRVSSK